MKNSLLEEVREELIAGAAHSLLKSDEYYQTIATSLISAEELKQRDLEELKSKLQADDLSESVNRGFQLISGHMDEVLDTQGLKAFREDASKINDESIKKWVKEAVALQRAGKHTTYQEYFGLQNETLSSIYKLGIWYFEKKEYQNASDVFSAAMTINPYISSFWKALGFCSYNRGMNGEALRQFNMACILDPSDVEPHILFAEVCLRLDRNAEAEEGIERASYLIKGDKELERKWSNYLKALQIKTKGGR